MADPLPVPCPEGQWTKIATNAVSGTVRILLTSPHVYLQTYRTAGGAAPTNKSDAAVLKDGDEIGSIAGIDVYVWAEGKAGSVRVDLP
jgi:hypothetical protein